MVALANCARAKPKGINRMITESSIVVPTIESVDVLSTGSGEQHKEHRYGSRKPKTLWALTSRSWIDIPINVFVIQHRDGLVLFDTGLNPSIATDPNYVDSAIGRFFMRRVFRLHIEPEDRLTNKLGQLGYAASEIRKVVFSHLHFDHIGGIAEVPQAELVVSRKEWEQLQGPHPERDYIFREHIELPNAKWNAIDFEPVAEQLLSSFEGCYDLMGDGSLILLPTPGHTVGSLSMLIRTGHSSPILLVGDLTYETELLMKDRLPGIYADKKQLKTSFALVRELKRKIPYLLIISSHDPRAASTLRSAFSQ